MVKRDWFGILVGNDFPVYSILQDIVTVIDQRGEPVCPNKAGDE